MANAAAADYGRRSNKISTKTLKIILLILVVALAALVAGIYISLSMRYQKQFFQGTKINQLDAGNKTPEQIQSIFASQADDYKIEITFRNNQTETITADQIDYQYVPDDSIQKLLESQNAVLWPKGYFTTTQYTVTTQTKYDEQKLTDAVMALPEMQDANMTAPTKTHVAFENGSFSVRDADQGSTLNKDTVVAAVKDAVSKSETSLSVNDVENAYASVTDDTDRNALQSEADLLNKYAAASITYTLPSGETQVLDGTTLMTWLDKDENGDYIKNDESWNAHIKQYVKDLAAKVNTVKSTRTFNATGVGAVQVRGGNYGYKVNQDAEIQQLTSELESGTVTTREPNYSSREVTTENGGFGSSYIEVDLSRQHMWVYQNGSVILESDVVSGKMTRDRYTPSGVFQLAYKEKDRDLKGEIDPSTGEPSYVSHVNNWMPFNGGIGFHDASWRSSFGGTIYINSGSHGCVNLPTSFAPKLYDVISKDMPIVVYYSQGCKFES